MTVSELIKHLCTFPADARVVIPHFFAGFDDVSTLVAPIKLGESSIR